ncbi:MAG: FRG domain-containing protein [Balneola sp.]
MNKEIEIKSLVDYLNLVKSLRVSEIGTDKPISLFRGQRDISWRLEPQISILHKKQNFDNPVEIEKKLIREFKRIALTYEKESRFYNDWEILSLARHHGLPTRLLDWTENPLTALWFVLKEILEHDVSLMNSNSKDDILEFAIWYFKGNETHLIDPKEESPFNIGKTKILKPSFINKRILAQSSWFTSHVTDKNFRKYTPLEANSTYRPFVRKCIIKIKNDYSLILRILDELSICGISYLTLFPDYDGISKHLLFKILSNESRDKKRAQIVELLKS